MATLQLETELRPSPYFAQVAELIASQVTSLQETPCSLTDLLLVQSQSQALKLDCQAKLYLLTT